MSEAEKLEETPTSVTYKGENGQPFNEQRTALHDRIIRTKFRDVDKLKKPQEPEKPVLLIIAGGPGAGKSALSLWMRKYEMLPERCVSLTLNPYNELPEFQAIRNRKPPHPHPEKSSVLWDEYYHLRHRLLEGAIQRNCSITLEDHCSNPEADIALLKRAKEAGYETYLIGISLSPAGYFAHVRQLNVTHEYTPWALSIHKKFAESWDELVQHFDHSILFQCTDKGIKLSQVAEYDKKPDGTLNTGIVDGERYDRFKEWEHVNLAGTKVEEGFPMGEGEESTHYARRVGKIRSPSQSGDLDPENYPRTRIPFVTRLLKQARHTISIE